MKQKTVVLKYICTKSLDTNDIRLFIVCIVYLVKITGPRWAIRKRVRIPFTYYFILKEVYKWNCQKAFLLLETMIE